MRAALDETNRRREKQAEHNAEHSITPTTVRKTIFDISIPASEGRGRGRRGRRGAQPAEAPASVALDLSTLSRDEIHKQIKELRHKMWSLARDEKFEEAADVRDDLKRWEQLELQLG